MTATLPPPTPHMTAEQALAAYGRMRVLYQRQTTLLSAEDAESSLAEALTANAEIDALCRTLPAFTDLTGMTPALRTRLGNEIIAAENLRRDASAAIERLRARLVSEGFSLHRAGSAARLYREPGSTTGRFLDQQR